MSKLGFEQYEELYSEYRGIGWATRVRWYVKYVLLMNFKDRVMYIVGNKNKSQLKSVEVFEGECIEEKVERVVSNNEPITDGAPSIFTERKDGVISAYNIRTDRWEIACEAMDVVAGSIQAKREGKGAEMKVVKDEIVGEAESAKGTSEGSQKADG